MMKLHKYWFKFALTINEPHPIGVLLGCGVTAISKDEALVILREQVFHSIPMPAIEFCVEDVSISDLDKKHILPNVGNSAERGVWFPLGYQSGHSMPQGDKPK